MPPHADRPVKGQRFYPGHGLLAAVCALCLFVPAPTTAKSFKPGEPAPLVMEAQAGDIRSYQLANGFKILLVPYPHASDTRLELLIKSGSKTEPYGQTGTAHLLEHMMFKRAGKRRDVGSQLSSLATQSNAVTSADYTRYFATVLPQPDRIEKVLRIQADQFLRPVLDPRELALEIQVVLNELQNTELDAKEVTFHALARNSFTWHGYARPVIGAASDLRRATVESLRSFHRTHYRPDNAVLIVSGRFDPAQVLSLAQRLFSKARNPPGAAFRNHTTESSRATTQRSDIFLPTQKGIRVASAWRLPGYAHQDLHAADLGMAATCDVDWGSLKKVLVQERQLAHSASCFVVPQADYSLLMAFAHTNEAGDAQALLQAMTEHVQAAATKGVNQQQIDRAKITSGNYFEKLTQTHADMVSMLVDAEVAGDWRLAFWVRETTQSMLAERANEVMRQWVVAHNRADVVVRQATAEPVPGTLQPADIAQKLGGKTWTNPVVHGAPPPASLDELAQATRVMALDEHGSRAALITRQTQNDKVWVEFRNDYGNAAALTGRTHACWVAEVLMMHGGDGLTRDELSALLEPLNARYEVNLDGFSLEIPRQHLHTAFKTLFQVWNRPLLPAAGFESVKARFISSYEKSLSNPSDQADLQLRQRFDNFAAGHPDKPAVMEASLRAMSDLELEDVRRCAHDFAALSHARIGVVGAVSEPELKSLWSGLNGPRRSTIPYERIESPAAPQAVDTTAIVQMAPGQTHADIKGVALLALSARDEDDPALQLATKALDKRLWRALRTENGLSYRVGASLDSDWLGQRALFEIQASASSGNADEAETRLKSVLADSLAGGFTAAEIAEAKRDWAETRKANLDMVNDQVAQVLVESLLDGASYQVLARYDNTIRRMTATQVNAAWNKRLSGAPVVWVTVKGDK